MTLSGAILTGLVICAGLFSFWVYSRRELPIPAWRWLAGLRFLILSVVLILIWDPLIPVSRTGIDSQTSWILVDGSLSMKSSSQSQNGPLDKIIEKLEDLRETPSRILLFGERPRFIPMDSLELVQFNEGSSKLGPALIRAAEVGASEAIIFTDFRIDDDLEDIRSYIEDSPVDVRFERVDSKRRNVGVRDFSISRNIRSDESIFAEVSVFSEGLGERDKIKVQIFQEETSVAVEEMEAVSEGRLSNLIIDLPEPKNPGWIKYRVEVEILADDFELDNQKYTFFETIPEDKGIVLVSFEPDWEPRFLLPVLSQASGLSAEGFLALGEGQYLSMKGTEPDEAIAEEYRVREAVERSRFLVVHGFSANSPEWVHAAVQMGQATLVFLRDGTVANDLGISTQERVLDGEWYLENRLKPSPLAASLSGGDFSFLPPLSAVLPLSVPSSHLGPLEFRRDGIGQTQSPLVLVNSDEGRKALVLASGFWRWFSKGGSSREIYRRLWAGVLGWLMASEILENRNAVEPDLRVWRENVTIEWTGFGLAGSTINLAVSEDETATRELTVVVDDGGRFVTDGLPSGDYTYQASDFKTRDVLGTGRFRIENHSLEWFQQPKDLESVKSELSFSAANIGNFSRSLHTFISPYLLLMFLLSLEWIGRRQGGLR